MRNKEEEQHCVAFFEWCQLQANVWPELKLIHHIPNGGMRPKETDAKGKSYSPEGARLKRMGAKKGVLDYNLSVPSMLMGALRPGLWLEFKAKGRTLTPDQREFAAALEQQGHVVFVAYDWEAAKGYVTQYLGMPEAAIINGRKQ